MGELSEGVPTNMRDADDEEEGCPGEDQCEDPYCDERQVYEVTIERTVTFTVRAHSQEEADTAPCEVGSLTWTSDSYGEQMWGVEDIDEGSDEASAELEREVVARRLRWQRESAEFLAAMREETTS